jgi:DNA-binding response OmpR family regulator
VPIHAPIPGSGKIVRTIALIDDDNDDEFFLKRALKKAEIGSGLLRFHDGQQGIDYFARKGRYADKGKYPDAQLVFLDINMPEASGFDVLKWLHANQLNPSPFVVVMLTSSDNPRDRQEAQRLGALDYAIKPPSPALFDELAEKYSLHWQFQGI